METVIVQEGGAETKIFFVPPINDETSEELGRAFQSILPRDFPRVELDMTGIDMLHTNMLGAIVFAYRKIRKANGALRLTHLSPDLKNLLKTFALDKEINLDGR